MSEEEKVNNVTRSWMDASGPIDYTMTNDYMFRMVLQNNELVLRGLISSVMHIPMEKIATVQIENPISPGDDINDKTFIMDVRIRLNDASIINLEMQVVNLHNWRNRSLSYLCRTFDQLQKGEDYNCAVPVTHIGFLDFDLFPEELEFYAKYQMLNVKTHKVYNDKFILRVLSLNQTELATEEDRQWHIDEWARLFKAKTWEDIKMLAKNNEVYSSAASSIYYQNSDRLIREKCQAREEAIRHEEYMQNKLSEMEEAREEAIRHEEYMQNKLSEMEEAREEAIRHEEYMQNKLSEMEEAREEAIRHEEYMQNKLSEMEEAREEAIREMEEAREEAIRHEEYMQNKLSEMEEKLQKKEAELQKKEAELKKLKRRAEETQ